ADPGAGPGVHRQPAPGGSALHGGPGAGLERRGELMAREKRPMAELSQVLADVLKEAGLGHLPYEDKLRRNWETLLGKKAAHIATLDSLRGWVLNVKVESAVWRQELS